MCAALPPLPPFPPWPTASHPSTISTLPLSHCSNTFPPSTGQTKNKFPLLLIFGNIFTERKNANTYLSLPYAKLVRNCPHPPKKENNILSHTRCVRFPFSFTYTISHVPGVCVRCVTVWPPEPGVSEIVLTRLLCSVHSVLPSQLTITNTKFSSGFPIPS